MKQSIAAIILGAFYLLCFQNKFLADGALAQNSSQKQGFVKEVASPLEECKTFLEPCSWGECCSGAKLECEEGICLCDDDMIWDFVNKDCRTIYEGDDVDEILIIVFSVIGGVVLIAAIGFAVFYFTKKRKRSGNQQNRWVAAAPSAPAAQPAANPYQAPPIVHVQGGGEFSNSSPSNNNYYPPLPGPSSLPPPYSETVHQKH